MFYILKNKKSNQSKEQNITPWKKDIRAEEMTQQVNDVLFLKTQVQSPAPTLKVAQNLK
jgi:hypothetical protein